MVQIGFKCNKGVVRKNNEDACFVIPSHDVYIVADGVGGNNSGEVASRTAVSGIAEVINESGLCEYSTPEEIFGFLDDTIADVNSRIYHMGIENESNRGMATTLVMAYIRNEEGYIANIGDSRMYVINDFITQITKDHSLVEEMVDMGGIDREAARTHPDKNIITRAIGVKEYVLVDFFDVCLGGNEKLLLCTDGLTNMLKDDEIHRIISGSSSLSEAGERLIEAANENGGRDNIAVVLVEPFGGQDD